MIAASAWLVFCYRHQFDSVDELNAILKGPVLKGADISRCLFVIIYPLEPASLDWSIDILGLILEALFRLRTARNAIVEVFSVGTPESAVCFA